MPYRLREGVDLLAADLLVDVGASSRAASFAYCGSSTMSVAAVRIDRVVQLAGGRAVVEAADGFLATRTASTFGNPSQQRPTARTILLTSTDSSEPLRLRTFIPPALAFFGQLVSSGGWDSSIRDGCRQFGNLQFRVTKLTEEIEAGQPEARLFPISSPTKPGCTSRAAARYYRQVFGLTGERSLLLAAASRPF